MEIILADVLGYCMGVRRAVECALNALDTYKDKIIYSLGPLIHNRIALDSLAKKGLIILDENDIQSVKENSVVLIRAHGIGQKTISLLKKKNCIIEDATCPKVVASQKIAKKYSSQNKIVILVGDKNHGEVSGIQGYVQDEKKFFLIQNANEAQQFSSEIFDGAVLLCQTTFSASEFNKITEILAKKIKNLEILKTICPATMQRQQSLLELCPKVQGVIVVGGKNSANSKRLFQIAQENCKKACLIEDESEIPKDFFCLQKVGITAGASTPDEVIESVRLSLCRNSHSS